MTSKRQRWGIVDLGRVPYEEAWALQTRLVEARAVGTLTHDVILVLEHPPVFTLGKRGGRESLLVPEGRLKRSGIGVVQVERGGNITYHGPGQLVLYPIVHLPGLGIGVVDLVDRLEEVMIRTCTGWGVRAERNPINRGVWVGLKKIGAIGIAVRRGVSFHGMALNVDPDLTPFSWIQPCGLQGVGVTSIAAEAAKPVGLAEVKGEVRAHIEDVFQIGLATADRQDLLGFRCPEEETPCENGIPAPAAGRTRFQG
ncbi:MAG: lipoyl(octanoyl) transferase LipB [Desulfobacterales bacterium]